jgi:hypothetical protein
MLRTSPRSSQLAAQARVAFTRERELTALGIAGLVIAAVCFVGVLVRGTFVQPEGKLFPATTFTFGVAVFSLTIALLLPLAGYSARARRRWRLAFGIFIAYGLVIEPVQAFRGIDPRFTEVGGVVDQVAGGVFGVTAVLLTLAFVALTLRFFRSDVLVGRPPLRDAIRYGAVAVCISFGIGILMSILQGREVGEGGDLMIAHALGVHGIQTLPLVGLIVTWTAAGTRTPVWLHVCGVGWLTACTASLLEALIGRRPFEMSVLPAVVILGLVAYVAAACIVVLSLRRAPRASAQLVEG